MPAREPIAILETDIARLERIGKCGHLGTFRSPDLWRLLRRRVKQKQIAPAKPALSLVIGKSPASAARSCPGRAFCDP